MKNHPEFRVVAAAAVALGLGYAGGCEKLESDVARADKRVAAQIEQGETERQGYSGKVQEKVPKALESAAAEAGASNLAKARAKSALAQAELEAGTAVMHDIDAVEAKVGRCVWEIGALAAEVGKSNQLVDRYAKSDPQAALAGIEQRITEAQGGPDKKSWFTPGGENLPTLGYVKQDISRLEGEIAKLDQQIKSLTEDQKKAEGDAGDLARQSDAKQDSDAKQSDDSFKQSAELRKKAGDLASQAIVLQDKKVPLEHELKTAQAEQKILEETIKSYEAQREQIKQQWEATQKQMEAQRGFAQTVLGKPVAVPAAAPAASGDTEGETPAPRRTAAPAIPKTPATINSKVAEMSGLVAQARKLREAAQNDLNNAINHFTEAIDAADKIASETGRGGDATRGLSDIYNAGLIRLQAGIAQVRLAELFTGEAASLSARSRLAASVAPVLQKAKVGVPRELDPASLGNELKDAVARADAAWKAATETLGLVIEGGSVGDETRNAAHIERMLAYYGYGQLKGIAGDPTQAQSMLKAAQGERDYARQQTPPLTLPALPTDLSPVPAAATTGPATAPAPGLRAPGRAAPALPNPAAPGAPAPGAPAPAAPAAE